MKKVFIRITALDQSSFVSVPHNRFGDLVEATLKVEQSTIAMYQSRQESKRSALGASQQSFGQYSRK